MPHAIGTSDWRSLKMKGRDDKRPFFTPTFTATAGGELRLAANDMDGWWKFDRYDNNKGWIWVRVERL